MTGATGVVGDAVAGAAFFFGSSSTTGSGSSISVNTAGAGAQVPMHKVVPAQARALGVPCVIKENAVDGLPNKDGAQGYVSNAKRYLAELRLLS